MTKTYDTLTYVICHNGSDVVHPGEIPPGVTLSTGQPNVEEFTDKEAWKARLVELKYDVSKLEPLSPLKLDENGKPIPPTPEEIAASYPGRPGMRRKGPLSIEERKTMREQRRAQMDDLAKLPPEQRKAKRQELRTQRLQARLQVDPENGSVSLAP